MAALDEPLPFEEFPNYLKTHKLVDKYDSSEEPKSPHPWWELDKRGIDAELKEFAQLVIDALKGLPDNDKELQHLLRAASALSQVERSPAIKVALIGAQGAGKSLLTNALFDCDGLSITGADGQACTSAITRYAHYPGENDQDGERYFFAEVRFFNAEKMETMINEHARSYYYYQNDDDSDDEDEPRVKSRRQDEQDRRAKDTAEDVFNTLFGSREKFLECWSPSAYKSGEFSGICQHKCDEAIAKLNLNSQRVATYMGNDQGKLLERIKPFLTKVKGEVCLWPLVDSVTVRFRHDLLQQGIELIDLPGWGDINLSRVRHAEDIKDSVDVEILVADTIRIASDDAVINNARAAITLRGAANVRLVATKIDSLTPNQLSQCSGPPYDRIKEMIQEAEEEENRAEEEDDIIGRDTITKYKSYLQRCLKQRKITDRANDITLEISTKFQGRSANDLPDIFHASASDYMDSIKKTKIKFADQPALSPSMTGIPAIRQFLFSLPAQKNLDDYSTHVNVLVPAFIEKAKRATTESDRDAGFRTLADEFDCMRHAFFKDFLSQTQCAFRNISKNCLDKMRADANTYKELVNKKLTKHWFALKGPTFNKILKCRGTVPQGASKAKGLENGCNWNKELSDLLAPGFQRSYIKHVECMHDMKRALSEALDHTHCRAIRMMDDSSANLVVVEKAKKKWMDVRPKMQAKLKVLMDRIDRIEKRTLLWAMMEGDRDNNLVSCITDGHYDAVFGAAPALKPNPNGKKNPGYVSPKIKFQRDIMAKLFLLDKDHFVDHIITHFQSEFDRIMNSVLAEHFDDVSKLLETFSATLRGQAPVDYMITQVGEDIRSELLRLIPTLEDKSAAMREKMPKRIKMEGGAAAPIPEDDIAISDNINVVDLYEKESKRKRTGEGSTTRVVRIKKASETAVKRPGYR